MVKLIHNISIANDGEQNDNNNNVIKYLEANKDSLLYLAEKHYENLVEALTNNVVDTAANSSYNPKPALPKSSSIFQSPSNQSDIYRKEETETYHNSKGDIAE